MARFAQYLAQDIRRAKRLGVKVKRQTPGVENSAYRSHKTKNGKLRGSIRLENTRRPSQLAALRHEIGHHEVRSDPHDKRRLNKAYRDKLHRFLLRAKNPGDRLNQWYPTGSQQLKAARRSANQTRLHREEMLAWKNAIRRSPQGNIGSDAWKSFDTYGHWDKTHPQRVAALKRYQRMIKRPAFRRQFHGS